MVMKRVIAMKMVDRLMICTALFLSSDSKNGFRNSVESRSTIGSHCIYINDSTHAVFDSDTDEKRLRQSSKTNRHHLTTGTAGRTQTEKPWRRSSTCSFPDDIMTTTYDVIGDSTDPCTRLIRRQRRPFV